MLDTAGVVYSFLFAPEFVILYAVFALLGLAFVRDAVDARGLGLRTGAVLVAWSVAFAVYKGLPLLVGPLPEWGADVTGSLGLIVGVGGIWLVWRWQNWERTVGDLALLLVVVTVPHAVVTPFWNFSSHVFYVALPAGYLTLVDRRFAPTLALAVLMVPARPLAGEHTWPEAVGGLVVAALALALWWQFGPPVGRPSEGHPADGEGDIDAIADNGAAGDGAAGDATTGDGAADDGPPTDRAATTPETADRSE